MPRLALMIQLLIRGRMLFEIGEEVGVLADGDFVLVNRERIQMNHLCVGTDDVISRGDDDLRFEHAFV